MSKRKRERMKEKAARHKGQPDKNPERQADRVIEGDKAKKSVAKAALTKNVAVINGISNQPHLAQASPEWKQFYAAVSKTFVEYM